MYVFTVFYVGAIQCTRPPIDISNLHLYVKVSMRSFCSNVQREYSVLNICRTTFNIDGCCKYKHAGQHEYCIVSESLESVHKSTGSVRSFLCKDFHLTEDTALGCYEAGTKELGLSYVIMGMLLLRAAYTFISISLYRNVRKIYRIGGQGKQKQNLFLFEIQGGSKELAC